MNTPREDRLSALERKVQALEEALMAQTHRLKGTTIPGMLSVAEIRAAQPRKHTTHPPPKG